ncbi:YbhB/YbcL family Raf kinase inhibitor-like protein [Gryllotalpicola kribbensis]|uniref:YbhB/YbcL family Raf kinase inhibitor-like protein n=1 Tax=Gryllotalpicola kribbensis TaxID=993084 RepID=A0ABP8APH2_9MICO
MPANPLGRALRGRRAGHHTLVWARPELSAPEGFALTSPAFEHNEAIPERFKGKMFGATPSPAIAWTEPPAEAAELVLIVQDPDVPMGKPATHALAAGIDPALGGIAEGGLANPSPVADVVYGKGAFGKLGWVGPMPPRSHGPHAYVFQLFALDRKLSLTEGFSLEDALRAMAGHVIARARLDGIYEAV